MYTPEYNLINFRLTERASDDEKEAAIHIESLLGSLNIFTNNLSAVVSLFENLSEQFRTADTDELGTIAAWQHVAARDGAITIFNFRKMP
ncbi:MAG: hypothetical protein O7D34_02400 [Ignavibacteria bacterium]|nr:hypothetical protein [Ignavibacteria bacterium]